DGIRDGHVTGVQTCALPIWGCGRVLRRHVGVFLLGMARTVLSPAHQVNRDAWLLRPTAGNGGGQHHLLPDPAGRCRRRLGGERRSEERRVGKGWGSWWWAGV